VSMVRRTASVVFFRDGLPGIFFAMVLFILGVTPHFTPINRLRKGGT